jgi:hypothetical protein
VPAEVPNVPPGVPPFSLPKLQEVTSSLLASRIANPDHRFKVIMSTGRSIEIYNMECIVLFHD